MGVAANSRTLNSAPAAPYSLLPAPVSRQKRTKFPFKTGIPLLSGERNGAGYHTPGSRLEPAIEALARETADLEGVE